MTQRDIKPDKGTVPMGRPSKSDCAAIRPLWRVVNIEAEEFVPTTLVTSIATEKK